MGEWLSEVGNCDLCGTDLNEEEFFVDGRTIMGPWGLLCVECHGHRGVGLGTGKGQKYDSKTKVKVEG